MSQMQMPNGIYYMQRPGQQAGGMGSPYNPAPTGQNPQMLGMGQQMPQSQGMGQYPGLMQNAGQQSMQPPMGGNGPQSGPGSPGYTPPYTPPIGMGDPQQPWTGNNFGSQSMGAGAGNGFASAQQSYPNMPAYSGGPSQGGSTDTGQPRTPPAMTGAVSQGPTAGPGILGGSGMRQPGQPNGIRQFMPGGSNFNPSNGGSSGRSPFVPGVPGATGAPQRPTVGAPPPRGFHINQYSGATQAGQSAAAQFPGLAQNTSQSDPLSGPPAMMTAGGRGSNGPIPANNVMRPQNFTPGSLPAPNVMGNMGMNANNGGNLPGIGANGTVQPGMDQNQSPEAAIAQWRATGQVPSWWNQQRGMANNQVNNTNVNGSLNRAQ